MSDTVNTEVQPISIVDTSDDPDSFFDSIPQMSIEERSPGPDCSDLYQKHGIQRRNTSRPQHRPSPPVDIVEEEDGSSKKEAGQPSFAKKVMNLFTAYKG